MDATGRRKIPICCNELQNFPFKQSQEAQDLDLLGSFRSAPLGRNEKGIWWRRHDEY
jgi:predicted dithiol-disulfide oxidoreductase (DUF899 family)